MPTLPPRPTTDSTRLSRLRALLEDHQTEVKDVTGAVLGYTVTLDEDTTRRVFEIIDMPAANTPSPQDAPTQPDSVRFIEWMDALAKSFRRQAQHSDKIALERGLDKDSPMCQRVLLLYQISEAIESVNKSTFKP